MIALFSTQLLNLFCCLLYSPILQDEYAATLAAIAREERTVSSLLPELSNCAHAFLVEEPHLLAVYKSLHFHHSLPALVLAFHSCPSKLLLCC